MASLAISAPYLLFSLTLRLSYFRPAQTTAGTHYGRMRWGQQGFRSYLSLVVLPTRRNLGIFYPIGLRQFLQNSSRGKTSERGKDALWFLFNSLIPGGTCEFTRLEPERLTKQEELRRKSFSRYGPPPQLCTEEVKEQRRQGGQGARKCDDELFLMAS